MTIKSRIDPARMLEEQLAQASPDLLRELLGTFINILLSAEADVVCGAEYGTVSEDRTDRRNGCRHRDFDSRAGNGIRPNDSRPAFSSRTASVPRGRVGRR